MKSGEIRKIVKEITESKINNKTKVYAKKYKDFAESYPMLFEICCDNNRDLTTLYYMIDMLEKIQKKQMTEHVASVNVGQKLYDDYIKPVVVDEPAVVDEEKK
jgi:hypothetical protein